LHLGSENDFSGFFDVSDVLCVKDVSHHVLGYSLPAIFVLLFDPNTVIDAKARVDDKWSGPEDEL